MSIYKCLVWLVPANRCEEFLLGYTNLRPEGYVCLDTQTHLPSYV